MTTGPSNEDAFLHNFLPLLVHVGPNSPHATPDLPPIPALSSTALEPPYPHPSLAHPENPEHHTLATATPELPPLAAAPRQKYSAT